MNVPKLAVSGILAGAAVVAAVALNAAPSATTESARSTVPVAQQGDPLPTPVPDAVKQAPAPGEGPSSEKYDLSIARAHVAAEPHSAVCVAPDGAFTVVTYSPVLDAAGVPVALPVDFVPSYVLDGMPSGTTCETHDQLAAH